MLPKEKLEAVSRRKVEIENLLCSQAILSNPSELSKLNKELSHVGPVVAAYERYTAVARRVREDREALGAGDAELAELAHMELPELETELAALEHEVGLLLIPRDPNDERNVIVEIRSGEGGEEAALFAADLYRMIVRYAEKRRYTTEVLSLSESSAGGYKEVVMLVTGHEVYSHLRYEGGVHRVQRVPSTETQGRIHTSTATIAILPEADEVDVHIDEKDLQISIAASGGPGGQGVNTTNSAVQIKHIPTGMIVKCQDERSQLKNKARAMKVLRSRLLDLEQQKHNDAVSAERNAMAGSAERSAKVRTYNFPQNRVTDHRIGLTLHKIEAVLGGDLEEIIGALRQHRQAELLRGEKSD